MLMLVGLVVLPIAGILALGGVGATADILREHHPALLTLDGGEGLTGLNIASIIGFLAIGIGFLGSPQVFVRFLALKSEREINRGAGVALLWTLFGDTGAVLAGVVGRAVLLGDDLGENAQNVLPMMSQELFIPLISGVYVAVVLSAIMSTIDSLLVVASSAGVRDYYQKYLHPDLTDEGLVRLGRVVTMLLAVLSLAVAMGVAKFNEQREIFWFVIFGWSGIAATFCPTIILSLFWRGFTARGAKAAMVVGFACVPIFKFGATEIPRIGRYFAELDVLAPSFAVSMLVGVLASLGDPRRESLRADAGPDLDWAGGREP